MKRSERLSRTASVAYTKGLLNNPGENNCFLNSAVQVLWHLDVFRRSFRELSGHFCAGESCIFCALKVIFTQIQYSDEAALPPDALRQALAVTFRDQQRFQLQDMDDAAECLENILSRLHFHLAMNEKDEICNAGHCISHRKFAMEIMEQSICDCGATSEPLPFFQLVHYVSVSALCREAEIVNSSKLRGLNQDMFGHLLKRAVNQGDIRDCPGNCGKRISAQQSLLNCPDVVCIGLIWDSDSPDIQQITQLLDCVDTVLRLPEVFPRVSDDVARKTELLLAGVVTYYGKHYSTFFYSNKLKTWIYFDDAKVRKCGSEWEKIRDKCCQNHYQPLLLLYVNPHGRPVNTKRAPQEVKLVDTETLLTSSENSRNRGSYSNDKAKDMIGGTPSATTEPKRKTDDLVGGLVSSPSTHSLGSERGSEKDAHVSTPERKRSKKSIKRLKTFGSDIKKVLARGGRNGSPTTELQSSMHSLNALSSEKVEPPKKCNSHEDLIDLSDDARHKDILSLYTSSTRGREIDECDSGLGSGGSQASSPATSSVSSVDTNTDDLIDLTPRTFPRTAKGNDLNSKLDHVVDEAESLLRRSYDLEKAGDTALALSLTTNATTRFRIAVEHCSTTHKPAFVARLKNKHNLCLERSRNLHQQITAEKEARSLRFSQQEKQELLMKQKERDQQVLRQQKQAPAMHGTLPRSSVKDRDSEVHVNGVVPVTSRAVNEVYLTPSSPLAVRRPNSRSHYPGSVGTSRKQSDVDFRDSETCSQKIKPDMLCYSPVHYGKAAGLLDDFERLKMTNEPPARDRKPTVTHVSTSFVPVRALPIEQTLLTSSAYLPPNSRTSVKDIRRCSIYDNMPPSDARRTTLIVPPRPIVSSSGPLNHSVNRVFNTTNAEERPISRGTPTYVDPPPYDCSRTRQTPAKAKNQPGTLLQRFNVPMTSRYSETVCLPDDVRRINEHVLAARPPCQRCRKTFVEKNVTLCLPCQGLESMLYNLKDDTAMHY